MGNDLITHMEGAEMEIEHTSDDEAPPATRQDDASRVHPERDCDSNNSTSRPINPHHRRNRPYRDRNSDCRRPDPRIRRGKLHVDFDSAPTHSLNRGRKADSHHPLIREEGTPFLAAMADTDFKEERDDRRDRGGYRGGNNKRRRDGK